MHLLSRLFLILTLLAPTSVAAQQDEWIAAIRGTVDIEGGLMRLAAQREGLIAEVIVKEGDRVKAGQIPPGSMLARRNCRCGRQSWSMNRRRSNAGSHRCG